MHWARLASVALALSLTGCFSCDVPGELDNLYFDLQLVDPLGEFVSGERILVGTRLCPRITGVRVGDGFRSVSQNEEAAFRACFDEQLEGPATLDDEGCVWLETPGEVTWTLTPTEDCEHLGDQLRFNVVGAALQLGFDDWTIRAPDRLGDEVILIGLAPGRSVDDLHEDPAAPRLVAADALDAPLMRIDDLEGRVYWPKPEVTLELIGEGVTVVDPVSDLEEDIDEWPLPGELPVKIELGGLARVRATLPSGEVLESPELIGVSTTSAASLDLIVLIDVHDGAPLYAFAEVRDARGRVLHGVPVEWSVSEGALKVRPGNLADDVRTADYATLGTGCEPPVALPIQRRATLRARVGALEDQVALVWLEHPIDPRRIARPFVPDERCLPADDSGDSEEGDDESPDADDDDDDPGAELDDGCNCSSNDRRDRRDRRDRPAPLAGLVALLGLGLLRRRRFAA